MIMRLFVIAFITCFAHLVSAQRVADTLFFEDYLQLVKAHHPFMQRADIQTLRAEAFLMEARGGFDPKIFADISQKYFNGDQYYSVINTGIGIPTWFGLSFYAGYDQTDGIYLNPQYRTPETGLVYAGAQLTLGQGLFIDKRRADLKQAKLFGQIADHERALIINDLLLEASMSYWDWYAARNSLNFVKQAFDVANVRYEAVRRSAILGERASIDTLELFIQVQNFKLLMQDFEIEELNKRLEASVFLWADGVPVELNEQAAPSARSNANFALQLESFSLQVDQLLDSHPEFQRDLLRIDQQQIDLRLKREMLKPVLNLKYNALNQPISNNIVANYALQNYTWGLDFSIPILLRKERAGVQLSKLRLQDMGLSLDNKRQLLLIKIRSAINEWRIMEQQYQTYSRNVIDINRLLIAEKSRFDNGESSVFLVNTRETSLVNAQIKLYELRAKSQKAIFKTYYSMALMEGL